MIFMQNGLVVSTGLSQKMWNYRNCIKYRNHMYIYIYKDIFRSTKFNHISKMTMVLFLTRFYSL